MLGGNEVVKDDDDVEPTLPLIEVDMSDDDIEERPTKRQRKLQTPSALEVVRQRTGLGTRIPAHVRMRTTSTHARRKVKTRRRQKEEVKSTECRESTSHPQQYLENWTAVGVQKVRMKDKWPLAEDLWPSEWQPSDVPIDEPLAEGKEEEDETETETLDQRFGLQINHQCLQPKIFNLKARHLGTCVQSWRSGRWYLLRAKDLWNEL